jgi:transcriptional regulator with XRE-family HTH domain
VTDTLKPSSKLRRARDAEDLSREYVARLLQPPVSMKTLERWENGTTPIPMHRRRELAAIYRVPVEQLRDDEAA